MHGASLRARLGCFTKHWGCKEKCYFFQSMVTEMHLEAYNKINFWLLHLQIKHAMQISF